MNNRLAIFGSPPCRLRLSFASFGEVGVGLHHTQVGVESLVVIASVILCSTVSVHTISTSLAILPDDVVRISEL